MLVFPAGANPVDVATYIVCLSARPPMRLIPEKVGQSESNKSESEAVRAVTYVAFFQGPLK